MSSSPHRSLAGRSVAVGALVLAAVGVVLAVQRAVGDDGGPTARALPACADVDLDRELQERVRCRTQSAVLTIVDGARPVVMPEVEARLSSAARDGRTIRVRLRLRNATDVERTVGERQVYLVVGGARAYPTEGLRPLAAGAAEELALRFRVSERANAALRAGEARAELGITTWTAPPEGRRREIGVIRLDLG